MSAPAEQRSAGAEEAPQDWLGRMLQRLPEPIRPRARDRESHRRRRVEMIVLVVVAIVLAVGTIYDATRAVGIDYRLSADIETWRQITGIPLKEVSIEQDMKHFTKHDVACGNIPEAGKHGEGKPGARTQLCLVMIGPIVKGRRETHTGFFVPPKESDQSVTRYGCFGSPMTRYPCEGAKPAGAPPDTPPKGFEG